MKYKWRTEFKNDVITKLFFIVFQASLIKELFASDFHVMIYITLLEITFFADKNFHIKTGKESMYHGKFFSCMEVFCTLHKADG